MQDIKRTSDDTRSKNVEEPKSQDTWRRMCKLADKAKQQTEKQIVLSDRATPEKPGLYGGMYRGDGASSSRDYVSYEGYDRIRGKIDEIAGNFMCIAKEDIDELNKLAGSVGLRKVVEALKQKLETDRRAIIFQAIAELGNRTDDFPCLEKAFIDEGHKCPHSENMDYYLPEIAQALVKIGGTKALPALKEIYRHNMSLGLQSCELLKEIGKLEEDGIFSIGSNTYRRMTGWTDLGRMWIEVKCLSAIDG